MRIDRRTAAVLVAGLLLVVLGAVTVSAQTKPIANVWPTGDSVWLGSSIGVKFDQPMDRASVEAALSIEPAPEGHLTWSDNDAGFEFLADEPLAEKTKYVVTIGTGIRSARGEEVLDRPYVWSFTTREATEGISFSYGIPVQVTTPSGGRGVPIQPGYPRVTLDFALYTLDTKGFAERYDDLEMYRQNKVDLTGLEQIASWSAHIDATSSVGEVALPMGTAPGLYVLDARHASLGNAQTVVVYSDYGLVAKQGREGAMVWVTTVPSGEPTAGATVSLHDSAGQVLGTATSSPDGIAEFDSPEEAIFATAEYDGQITLVGLDSYWCSHYSYCGGWWDGRTWNYEPPEYAAHIHTDRPIYRPGHTVYYKASLRHLERDGYSVPLPAIQITTTIRDATGSAVVQEPKSIDLYGSVAGEFQLGEDVSLGSWRIEVATSQQTFTGYFQVEEYVKPDFEVVVETDEPFYVRGDTAEVSVQADYYFGQPAADADVTLRVYRGYYYYGRGGNLYQEFQGMTDDEGSWQTSVTLPGNESNSERYYFEAEVVDASRRPVVEESSVPVYPADFDLRLRGQRYGVEVGQPVQLTATTMLHDGEPAKDRLVVVEVRQYFRGGYQSLRRDTITTDADGTALLTLRDLTEGWYSIYATAEDDAGRRVEAYSYAWLFDRYRPWYWWGGLEMSADRDDYAPGDQALLLVKSPITTTALVTLERDEVYDEYVVEVSGATTIEVPIKPEYAPNVYARVQLWEPLDVTGNRAEGQLLTAQVNLLVPALDRRLEVDVKPDADTHEPGEEALFTVTVTDAGGKPVQAQMSFALVDKAVLALTTDRSGDIFDAFWGPRSAYVGTYDSLRLSQWYGYPERGDSGQLPPGAATPAPATGTPGAGEREEEASQSTPRRDFPDTAFWKADIETDANGTATVRLNLPDNLTTWQAMVRAITKDTLAGQGSGELVVTKAVIADPAIPRFAVQGDQFAVDVLARNYAGGTLDAVCSLDSPGLFQLDPGAIPLTLPFNETHFARWTVVASDLGENPVTGSLVTAAGDDVIEVPLEVQPFTVPDRYVVSGSTEDTAYEDFEVAFNAVPETSEVEIRLSPGVALGILDGLEDLIGYPYGCIEQTMGRLFPNAVVGRLVNELGVEAPEITDQLPELMSIGLQKIYGYQQEGGGWGWWRGDGNIYITAYVLHGLTLTEQAGYDVDDEVLERGFTWLAANLETEADERVRAYALYVMASADRGLAAEAEELFLHRGELDAFGLAALSVALDKAGRADLAATALDELEAMASVSATTASWPLDVPNRYRWDYYHWYTMASTTKNTAMALDALAILRPDSPLAVKAARWLMENRWGRGWMSTQATAFTVLALTDYIVGSGELWADYDWEITLDSPEQVIARGSVDASNVTERIDPIIITGDLLTPGEHTAYFRKVGQGTLFYTLVSQLALYHEGFADASAEGFGIRLTRAYTPIEGRSDADGWNVGDVVNVRLTLETTDALHYMLIEDMLPAGLEALNERLETETTRVPDSRIPWRWWGYERKEIRDEKVTFFDTYLPPGTHSFDYAARAVTPGIFSARPAEAYAMYRPEVWGRSASDQVAIDPKALDERPPLEGDYNRDCRLSTFDAALVAADWGGIDRDLNGDGVVDVADIVLAVGRAGRQCGDGVPLPPGPAGELALALHTVGEVRQGEVFEVEVTIEGSGNVGGYELVPSFDTSALELVGASRGDLLPDAFLLGSASDPVDRIGGYSVGGTELSGTGVVARIAFKALTADPTEIGISSAKIVTDTGGEYQVTYDGTIVSPEPWTPKGQIYLPYATVRQ